MIPGRMRHRIRNWLSTKLSGSGSGVHVPRWKGTIHVESVLVNGSQPSGVSGPQAHRKTVPLNSQIDVARNLIAQLETSASRQLQPDQMRYFISTYMGIRYYSTLWLYKTTHSSIFSLSKKLSSYPPTFPQP